MLGAMSSPWFDGSTAGFHEIDGLHLHARIGGRADAPALLMLHGFPQTHAMWHRVAQQLAPHFRIVSALTCAAMATPTSRAARPATPTTASARWPPMWPR